MAAQIQLGWNNNQLRAGASGAAAIVSRASADMKKSLGSINTGLGAGLGFGLFDTAKTMITGASSALYEATVTADSLRNGMTALEGSVEGANQRLTELRVLAKDPGLGFEQVVQGDISLRSVGLSAELSTRAMREFGNALTAVGKGKADLDGVLLAITQIVSKGKVSAEEINQIAERVPQIRKVMQEAFGTADTEAIQQMGVPVERFVEIVISAFERTIPRAIAGLQGKIDNFSDAVTGRLADVGTGVIESVIGPLEDATKVLEDSSVSAKTFGSMMGLAFKGIYKELQDTVQLWYYWSVSIDKTVGANITLLPALDRVRIAMIAATAAQEAADISALKNAKSTATVKEKLDQAELSAKDYEQAWWDIAEAQKAAAEQSKKNSEEIAKLKSQLDAANEAKLDMQLDNNLEKLGLVEAKLLEINQQLNATRGQKNGEKITAQLDIERVKAETEILRLNKAINAESERAVVVDIKSLRASAEKVSEKERSLQLFDLELSIQQALAKGQDEKARRLQEEADIIETTARLVSELGLSYEVAAQKATDLVKAKSAADARQSGRDENGRRRIQGYSQDQGTAADARDRARLRTNEARQNYEDSIAKFFGTNARGADPRALPAGGRMPAAEAARDSGLSELTASFDAFATRTTEIFERALN